MHGAVAAQQVVPPWTPSSIASVLDWVDCADTSKITAASNLVSAVVGQRGVLTWSQSTGNNKPKSGLSTINGRNVLDFGTLCDPTNKFRYLDSGTTSYTTTGCHYWCIVQVAPAFDATDLTFVMDGTAAQRAAFYYDGAGNSRGLSLFAGNYPNLSSFLGDTSLHLLIGNFASGGTSNVYVDGTQYSIGDPGNKTPTASRIGIDAASTTGGQLNGHVCAWGIGTTIMSGTDRASLLAWANAQWLTAPVIIDADHSSDADDVGDQAHLAYFMSHNRINVIGAGVNEPTETKAAGALAAVYEHMAHPLDGTKVGAWKGTAIGSVGVFCTTLYDNYAHTGVGLCAAQPDATAVYRSLLAPYETAGRKAVWLLMTGGTHQIKALMDSTADGYSSSNGLTLIQNSCAGIMFVAGQEGTAEANIVSHTVGGAAAASAMVAAWPSTVPFVWCDIAIGWGIVIGASEWGGLLPTPGCPIRRAYDLQGFGTSGRYAWANLGIEYIANTGIYTTTRGTLAINSTTGYATWTPGAGGPHQRLAVHGSWSAANYATRWNAQITEHGT